MRKQMRAYWQHGITPPMQHKAPATQQAPAAQAPMLVLTRAMLTMILE
jgi:hypothetical protein